MRRGQPCGDNGSAVTARSMSRRRAAIPFADRWADGDLAAGDGHGLGHHAFLTGALMVATTSLGLPSDRD
jgi:hypothetical protein